MREMFRLQPDVFIGRVLGTLPHNPTLLERGARYEITTD